MTPQEYLISIVAPLLQNPNEFSITEKVDNDGIFLAVSPAKEDMARIIGKGGTTVEAIRTLMRQFGALTKTKVSMRVNEPDGSRYKSDNFTV